MRTPHLLAASVAAATALVALVARGSSTGAQAPEIRVATWINSTSQPGAALKGHVTLVEFWTFGCYNCRIVEPHVQDWYRKFSSRGLAVIGVHTPETAYERDVENVKRYVSEHHLEYPIAIDADSAIWDRYANQAWPAWYLIDKKGIIRHVHVGEGAYAETEREVEALLAEP